MSPPLKAGSNLVPELVSRVQSHSPTPGQAQHCPLLSGGRHNPPTLFRSGSKVSKPGLFLSCLDSHFVTDLPRGSWNHTETLPRLPGTSLEAHQFPGAANSTSFGREGGWKRRWDLQPKTPLSKNSSLLYQQPPLVQRAAITEVIARMAALSHLLSTGLSGALGARERRNLLARCQEEKHDVPATAAAFTRA